MAQRILSISGLRGIIGDGLDPVYITEFAAALGTVCEGKPVLVARDGRGSGEMIRHAVIAGLIATGCKVLDAGIISTPTAGVAVSHLKAAGGLQVTASHNPIEWNGLKPFQPNGAVYDTAWGERLVSILNSRSFAFRPWSGLGTVESLPNASDIHLRKVLAEVNPTAIQARGLHVVLDCNHGSGGVLGPTLLESLGCRVTVLGESPDGRFEHPPEPIAGNLTGLCDTVRRLGADVGFAQDPDADRLAIVDETGRYIGEELTLALCVDHLLPKRRGPVVVNGSTSRVTADLAAKHGVPFHRSYVGEANVVSRMQEVSAALGGEGNGGLIDPKIGFVRDSFAAMAYVLEGIASRGSAPLSAWVDSLPSYTIVKDKVTCPKEAVPGSCAALKRRFANAAASEGDGLRLDWNDRWVQVRGSNTEPIVRVIAEAPDFAAARSLCDVAMDIVRGVAGN
jgi:phosphomannomutase